MFSAEGRLDVSAVRALVSTPMKCPSCGTDSSGKFCSECGAPLTDAQCAKCSAPLLPGARYCTACGTPARSAIGGNTGWFVAAGVLVVMIGLVWILTSRTRTGDPAAVAGAGAAPGGAPFAEGGTPGGVGSATSPGATGAGSPPELTGTPREQADRLFNRIMSEREGGDTAKARFFLPMGIQAYKQAGDLEADGLFHLTLLQASAGQAADAMATAERILVGNPNHLLALGAAAEAAEEAGNGEVAAGYYARFLKAYPVEKTKTSAEYLDHSKLLPLYEAAAKRFLNK